MPAEASVPERAPTHRVPKASPSTRKPPTETPGSSPSPAGKRTLDDHAGERCPEAIGERFTIEGVLSAQGKYIAPHVTGNAPKPVRDCIEAFIRTRSFGTGRSMQPHTVRLAPR